MGKKVRSQITSWGVQYVLKGGTAPNDNEIWHNLQNHDAVVLDLIQENVARQILVEIEDFQTSK
eukprot:Pgem_evm1s16519